MTQHKFHREARLEYIEALLLLEEQRIGYGEKFEAEVEAVLKRIEEFPKSASLLKGFPTETRGQSVPAANVPILAHGRPRRRHGGRLRGRPPAPNARVLEAPHYVGRPWVAVLGPE
jgi:hypothetical protein